MIIGLSGYASSGKDTVAERLVSTHGFHRLAFADPIREMLYGMDPIVWGDTYEGGQSLSKFVDEVGWDVAKQHKEVRRLLQSLGYSARNVLGPDIWLSSAIYKMELGKNYVYTDVRFQNEADTLKGALSAKLWRVNRPGVEAANEHVSEWELNAYTFDENLGNDGTIEQLHFLVDSLVNKIL
jgi:hypothetical protein